MNYKQRMHPRVSRAEIELFKALSTANLTGGMVTQKPIILKFTIPDFCWMEKRKIVYLDGRQVHSTDKAERRDQEIDELLELQGWSVLRIVYDPPLTDEELQRVMEQIKQFLNVDEDFDYNSYLPQKQFSFSN
ncbi:MAG: endonuclease domain-containing protein [Nitrososphaerota archaeon]|nr:endonuclease domain-containing protein [Nitrososphaerota archaeon]